MSESEFQECGCRNLLADEETWKIILDPAFRNDPGAADSLARLLFVLKETIASGPEGSMRVINTLQDGIRMVWPYTQEHKLVLELYELYLTGNLKPWDEPRQLLTGALERFKAKCNTKEAKGRQAAKQSANAHHPSQKVTKSSKFVSRVAIPAKLVESPRY